eukprot:349641-Chlamydomonas_euryale.AAC.7
MGTQTKDAQKKDVNRRAFFVLFDRAVLCCAVQGVRRLQLPRFRAAAWASQESWTGEATA